MSLCDPIIILVQLLFEHPVQVIHTTVDGKTRGFMCKIYILHNLYTVDIKYIKYILYTTYRQWTGGDVMNFVTFEGKWE